MDIDKIGMGRSPMLEGDDGGGFGGGGDVGGGEADAGESRGQAVFDEPQEGHARTAEPSREPQPQTRPEVQPTVDARTLASEFGQVIGQHFRPPEPPKKEISVEEAKKLLNVWEPTKDWLARYDNLETRDQALAEQRDGFIKQAYTIMQYRMNELQDQIERRYAPMVERMQQQDAYAGEQRFGQTYPQLNKRELRPLLFSVAQSLLASGVKWNTERDMFHQLAKGVEAVIKVSNPQFSLEGNGSGAAPPGKIKPGHTQGGIPAMTPGSGGGGGAKGAGPPKPRGLAIFDP